MRAETVANFRSNIRGTAGTCIMGTIFLFGRPFIKTPWRLWLATVQNSQFHIT